jgi:purine-binding chemotaxis protein CheW
MTKAKRAERPPEPPRLDMSALNEEVLRRRAESLAIEEAEQAQEERVGVLLFGLGDEWYGVRIAHVREIYNEYVITPVPCVPDYILGVVNIRGEIVSVTDLRSMIGLAGRQTETEPTEAQPVIVVEDAGFCTALTVDRIGDIIDIAADGVEAPLAVTDKVQSESISGAFYTGGRLVAIVNVAKVLAPVGA